jgi:hypothetical protein
MERERHVMAQKLEMGMRTKMLYVALGAGKQIVDTKNIVTFLQQTIDQMRVDKSCAAGDQNTYDCHKCVTLSGSPSKLKAKDNSRTFEIL